MKKLKKRILIIDDEARINALYERILKEAGFETRCAYDAHQALNILIREDIDLVLLDISMPKIDGKTTFEIIREYNPSVKIIVSSVYPLHVQKQMIPEAYDYFDKSYALTMLLDKIAVTTQN